MAKSSANITSQVQGILQDIRAGKFAPVYLLMGEEPFYPDQVCDAVIENALEEDARDFDQFILYGSETTAEDVITAARGYSMFGGRVLVVLKEAQLMSDLENLSFYTEAPLDSTILVVLLHGASVDKRKAFYKSVQKIGVVVDAPAVRDYQIAGWITEYYASRGLQIDPQAARLLGEYAGTSLGTIATETDKLLKNLPEGSRRVTVEDIEKNVGISRQFSIFELTKALSQRDARRAMQVAERLGATARFQMPPAVSALYTHFNRILRYGWLLSRNPRPGQEEKAAILGSMPFFWSEYDAAVQAYPLRKCMTAISLLSDYDFKGKGGEVAPEVEQRDLLVELVSRLLTI